MLEYKKIKNTRKKSGTGRIGGISKKSSLFWAIIQQHNPCSCGVRGKQLQLTAQLRDKEGESV